MERLAVIGHLSREAELNKLEGELFGGSDACSFEFDSWLGGTRGEDLPCCCDAQSGVAANGLEGLRKLSGWTMADEPDSMGDAGIGIAT